MPLDRLTFTTAAVILVAAWPAYAGPSPADLRARVPHQVIQTGRAPGAIAGCLVDQVRGLGAASRYERQGGISVAFTMDATTVALFDIDPAGTVTVWRHSRLVPVVRRARPCL